MQTNYAHQEGPLWSHMIAGKSVLLEQTDHN